MHREAIVNLLRQSEQLLYTYTGPDFRIREVNNTFLQKFNLNEGECIGLPFHEVVAGLEKQKIQQIRNELLSNSAEIVKIDICVQKDGDENWFRWELSTDENRTAGIHIIGHDITQMKRAEKKLIYQASLLENISDAVVSTDTHFCIRSLNKVAEQIYEIKEQDAIGKGTYQVFNLEYVNDSGQHARKVLHQEGTWQGDVIHTQKNGNRIYLQSRISCVKNESGDIIGYVAVNRVNENHNLYKRMIHEIDEYAIFMLSPEGIIRDWNQGAERIKGYKAAEIVGQHFSIFYMEDERQVGLPDKMLQIAREQGKALHEGWRVKKDGSTFWAKVVITALHDEDGRVIGFSKVTYDITSKHLAEVVKSSEARKFRLAIDKLGDNVWEHDFEQECTRFSNKIQTLLGYGFDDIAENTSFWWEKIHPDDSHILKHNDENYRAGKIDSHTSEYRMIHKDGSIRWILDRGVVIEKKENGLPKKVVGTHTDVTERKNAEDKLLKNEKQFRDLVQNVPGVVYQWKENLDGSFGFTYVSPKLKTYFDIDPADMHLVQEYIHPDDKDRWRTSIEEANRNGGLWEFEGRLRYPDGRIKWWKGMSIMSETNDQSCIYNGIMIDITADRKQKEAIKAGEKRFREIFNSTFQFIGLLDTEGRLLEANETALEFGGLKPADVIGKHFWQCHWWTKSKKIQKQLAEAIKTAAGGEFVRYRVEVLGDGNRTAVIDFSIKPVKDDNGRVILLIPEGRDVTEQLTLERRWTTEKKKFETFMNSSPTMAWIVDQAGVFQYVNDLYQTSFTDGESIIGKSFHDLFPPDLALEYQRNNDIVFNTGQTVEAIENAQDPTGKPVILKVFKFPIQVNESETLLGGIALDITDQMRTSEELHRSKERYDYVNKATSDAIWDWDLATGKIFRGSGFFSLFGYPQKVSSFKLHLSLIHPEDRTVVADSIDALLRGNDTLWQREYRFRCQDGTYKIILDKAFVIRNAQGAAIRIIGAMQDVTERRRLEKKLIDEEVNRKREIINAIIHAQEKERKELADELHDNVNQILSSTKLMLEVAAENHNLTSHFLPKSRIHLQEAIDEIRRISHSLSPGVLKDISVEDAIREVVEKINQSGKMSINYQVRKANPNPSIPYEIRLSVLRIAQEQLNNILKHAGAKQVDILLLKQSQKIRLVIKDDGKGFDLNGVKKGLGLNNIYNRVEYYYGTVKLKSAPGAGCEMRIEIPF